MAKGQFEKGQTPWNKDQTKYPQLRDKEWLYHQYVTKELSAPEIAGILNCHPETVLRALKKVNIRIRTQSEVTSGKNNPNYGKHTIPWNKNKHPSEETLRKMSDNQTDRRGKNNTFYGQKHTAKSKEEMSKSKKGNRNSPSTEFKKGMTPWIKGKHLTEETKQKLREARKHQKIPKHHTKPERIFEKICKEHNLPFHYVGDSSLWIGKGKGLNPDFIEANGKKIVIEIFGDYWHSPLLNTSLRKNATLPYREKHYKRYGWKAIFIWESDLKREDAEEFVLATLKKEKAI